MGNRRRSDWIALTVLFAIVTIFFADVLTGRDGLFLRDLTRYYYPAKKVLREIVASGSFPWWNPMISAGQPMAANPEHEVFYPLTWLILAGPFRIGFHLLIVCHVYLALFGMYALLRSLRARPAASLFGAISFGFGGAMMATLNLLPILFIFAWFPLTALFARRYLMEPNRRDFALASLTLAMQLLVGEPVTAIQAGLLLGVYAAWRGSAEGWRGIARQVGRIAAICAAALGVSTVQTLAGIDFARHTVRARGLPFEMASLWSTPPLRIVELFFPHFAGHLCCGDQFLYWGTALYGRQGVPFFYSIYCGLAVAVLAVAGFLTRRGGALPAGILTVSAFALAFGAHTSLFRLLYQSGIPRFVRYPEKFLLLATFALVVFAALTLEAILGGDERTRRAALLAAAIVTAASVAAWIAAGASDALFVSWWSHAPTGAMRHTWQSDWGDAVFRAAVLLAVVALTAARKDVALWLRAAPWLFAAFAAADLFPIAAELTPRMPARFFEPPPLARALQTAAGPFRVHVEADWDRSETVAPYFRRSPAGQMWISRNALLPLIPGGFGIATVLERDFDLTHLIPTADFTEAMHRIGEARPGAWRAIAAAMSNVRYGIVYRDPAVALRGARDSESVQPARLVDYGPNRRFYFADQMVSIAGVDDFVRRLSSRPHSRYVAFVRGSAFVPAPGRILSVRESPDSVTIEASAEGHSWLVVAITPDRYWRMSVDGRPVSPVITNVGYQGIALDRGRHVVAMRYRNPLIVGGGMFSAAAALVLLAAAVIGLTREG